MFVLSDEGLICGGIVKMNAKTKLIIILVSLLMHLYVGSSAFGQQGPPPPRPKISLSYDLVPFQDFHDPDPSNLAGIQTRIMTVDMEAEYPFVFSRGQTVLTIGAGYNRRNADFRYVPDGVEKPVIDDLHETNLNLMIRHVLNQQWSTMFFFRPSLASDFIGPITSDDLQINTALILLKQFGRNWVLGFGAAYATSFGEPLPLPALSAIWSNYENMRFMAILPVMIEFWYRANRNIELGVVSRLSGAQYSGDPDAYSTEEQRIDKPVLDYSVWMVGPSARFHVSQGSFLELTGGFIPYHRYEFFDDEDRKANYNLEMGPIIKLALEMSL